MHCWDARTAGISEIHVVEYRIVDVIDLSGIQVKVKVGPVYRINVGIGNISSLDNEATEVSCNAEVRD